MIRYSPLLKTRELRVGRFDHPRAHRHHDPLNEFSREYSVSRVERGSFVVEIGRWVWELGPGDLFLNYPGMEYRCRHRQPVPSDECLSIEYVLPVEPSDEIVAFELVAQAQPVVRASNRLAYLFLRVARMSHEQMAAEEAAHGVMTEIARGSFPARRAYREHQLGWYAERVDAVRRQIDRNYALEHTLGGLARSAGMSPFHFARVFRELVGLPPHSYLRHTRLLEAARTLREGVTEACFSSGFQNLSHFSRQFQRHFGVKPSAYARTVTR